MILAARLNALSRHIADGFEEMIDGREVFSSSELQGLMQVLRYDHPQNGRYKSAP